MTTMDLDVLGVPYRLYTGQRMLPRLTCPGAVGATTVLKCNMLTCHVIPAANAAALASGLLPRPTRAGVPWHYRGIARVIPVSDLDDAAHPHQPAVVSQPQTAPVRNSLLTFATQVLKEAAASQHGRSSIRVRRTVFMDLLKDVTRPNPLHLSERARSRNRM